MSNPTVQQNRRILVIDDNPAIHEDFKKILNPASNNAAELGAFETELFGDAEASADMVPFQIDSAFQGDAGLKLVQQSITAGQPYAMVFMDVRMPPGWDGIETTAKIWEVDPDLQVVICTAHSDYSWDKMTAKLGISHKLVILKKPFDAIEVLQLTHALTEKWDLHKRDQAKMDHLEEMVAGRTRELQQANEKLKTEMAERAQAEAVVRQTQKMESLGQLAGGIAHDFNNLLTIIRGYVQCLVMESGQDHNILGQLKEIDTAAERAAKLTSQMLMFSRKKRIQPQPVDLNELITPLSTMLGKILGEDIAVEIQCPEKSLTVNADRAMIEQVILNLAVNARDAMPQGGRLSIHANELEIKSEDLSRNPKGHAGRFACCSVSDTGCGIAPEALPHLFEPFYTTKEPGKGTGLGLATAYGIVKQHEGWIEVESNPGAGARFKVFLPLSEKKSEPDSPAGAKGRIAGGTENILLVEDEPVVRRLAQVILQNHGYHIYEAGSGVEALAVWEEHGSKIDLLLTDMVMPGGLSGREVAERLREKKKDLKVVYTTGYSLDTFNQDLVLIDGLNFLAKPYHPGKLTQTVRRCLDEPAQVQSARSDFCPTTG